MDTYCNLGFLQQKQYKGHESPTMSNGFEIKNISMVLIKF
jgi:hypothetical protein